MNNCKSCKWFIYSAAILGTFLIVGWLVWLMVSKTRPEPVGKERAAARSKALADVRAADAQALNNIGWQDQAKGIVRLPIQQAKQLVIQQGKNPAAARSNLLARVDKATAVPPKAPEKPSEYE
jgi:hypothetical protein